MAISKAAGGMNLQACERNLVKWVAKLSPWLAPIPSGYFIAQASRGHLTIPVPIAIIIGFIIEFLGIASVHTWLWLMNWNATKRKRDPQAPGNLAILMGSTYIVTTIGLTVVLEIFPKLSGFAPAIFPILAVVGAVNLALIAQQETREQAVRQEKAERKISRRSNNSNLEEQLVNSVNPLSPSSSVKERPRITSTKDKKVQHQALGNPLPTPGLHTEHSPKSQFPRSPIKVNTKADTLNTILEILASDPTTSVTDLARQVRRSRTTIYKYLNELEQADRVSRNSR